MAINNKNKKWGELLNYESIRVYLNNCIKSKTSNINDGMTLHEKIESVNLSNYLKGVEHFFNEYSEKFKCPNEIVEFYKEKNFNSKDLKELTSEIENFLIWLEIEKGLSPNTAKSYYAMLRGFLKWNGIILKFKKYSDSPGDTKNLKIPFEKLKRLSFRIITYVRDIDLKLLLKFCQISGLSSNKVFNLRYADLRYKDYNKDFIMINGENDTTFLYGETKELIQKYLELNQNKSDTAYLFGDPKNSYQNFQRRFKRAYNCCIKNEFPEFLESKKTVATIHTYKVIIDIICDMLRISRNIKTLEDFKVIQCELFNIKENNIPNTIKKETIQELISTIKRELLQDPYFIEKILFEVKIALNPINTLNNHPFQQINEIKT